MVRLKTRWEDWESDGPGPFTFRAVIGTLIRGLRVRGLIQGEFDKKAYDSLMQECYSALTEPEEWWAEIPVALHRGRTPQQAELDHQIHRAVQRLWTKAVDTDTYDKPEWNELQAMLVRRGVYH